jgi:hypothetical protein
VDVAQIIASFGILRSERIYGTREARNGSCFKPV